MSFWTSQRLLGALPALIDSFDASRIDCNAYTLRVGGEVYISPSSETIDPSTQTIKQLGASEAFTIPPGQFAYVITEETVEIPADAMGFISIKAKIKFKGLVNVSGFHVDPGYKGRLIFAVFNAGPTIIHLRRSQDCFLIWFADLSEDSSGRKHGNFNASMPMDVVNSVAGELQSLQSLDKKIKDSERKLNDRISAVESKQSGIDARQVIGITLASAILAGCIVLLAKSLLGA